MKGLQVCVLGSYVGDSYDYLFFHLFFTNSLPGFHLAADFSSPEQPSTLVGVCVVKYPSMFFVWCSVIVLSLIILVGLRAANYQSVMV